MPMNLRPSGFRKLEVSIVGQILQKFTDAYDDRSGYSDRDCSLAANDPMQSWSQASKFLLPCGPQ